MRFHLVNLPHSQTTTAHCSCAYTSKVKKWCDMMHPRGHEVYLYSGEHNEAKCTEHVTIVTDQQQRKWFGIPGRNDFSPLVYDHRLPCWQEMNAAAIKAISERVLSHDFVCLIAGISQRQIADGLKGYMCVEYGVGYEGVALAHRCFESRAWQHYVYGLLKQSDGRNYDTVIPNYFDVSEFPFSAKKDDYYLFIGRLISRKGPQIAVEATKRIGAKLLLAGQGVTRQTKGRIEAGDIVLEGDHIEHVGTVGVEKRGKLMSRAKAVFVPTIYLEPFGGVAVEAMLCGTPVITSDYGAFPETVMHGVSGFRCNTLAQYAEAALKAPTLDPHAIRRHAMRFSLESIAPQYEEWFARLSTLWGAGWYA